ncbi:hypothetical protein DRQ26_03145 [bacterium]|nr:MAG: hypothetical protein DRQ26_03145 [bacterium]
MKKIGFVLILFFLCSALFGKNFVIRIDPLRRARFSEHSVESERCGIALVLSGGGSRGLAQIGVLQVLDSIGVHPDIVIGTSIGAIVGGLYAAGYSPSELESLATSLDLGSFLSDASKRTSIFLTQRESAEQYFLTIRLKNWKPYIPSGYLSAQRLLDLLSEFTASANVLADKDFDNLPIPFRSVITDIATGNAVVLSDGNLGEAMRASIGVPLIFQPFPVNGHLAVDGGLKMPVPVEVARELGCKKIIAVNTTADLIVETDLTDPSALAEQATTIMQRDIIESEKNIADVWIEPDLKDRRSTDFGDAEEIISRGRKAAEKMIPEIELAVNDVSAGEIVIDSVCNMLPCIPDSFSEPLPGIYTRDSIIAIAQNLANSGWFSEVVCSLSSGSPNVMHIKGKIFPKICNVVISPENEVCEEVFKKFRHRDFCDLDFLSIVSCLDSVPIALHRRGFTLARWDTIYLSGDTLFAKLNPCRIEKIFFSGNEQTRHWVLASNFGVEAGEVFNQNRVQSGISSFYSTGLFQWVNYDLAPGDSGGVILNVRVQEKPNIAIRFGIRYDQKNRSEGAVGIFDDNLFGTALRIGLEGYGGERRQDASISIGADRIWKTMLTSQFYALYHREKYDHFHNFEITNSDWVEQYGGRVAFGHQLRKLGTLLGEIETQRIRVASVNDDNVEHYIVHKLRLHSVVDSYDKKQFPTKGNFYQLSFETSQDILGGQTSFTKFFARLGMYQTISWFTLNEWIIGGHIAGTPPFFEKFSIGEKHHIWGFRGDELLGDDILNAGINIRINFTGRMKRLYFLSGGAMGNLWSKDMPPEASKTIWCSGAGIGLETIIGPLFVTYGVSNMKTRYFNLRWGYEFK